MTKASTWLFVLSLILVYDSREVVAEESQPALMQTIVAAMKARERSVRSLKINWVEQVTDFALPTGKKGGPFGSRGKSRETDIEYTLTGSVVIDGKCLKFSSVNEQGVAGAGTIISTFDGSNHKMLDSPNANRPFFQGTISRVKGSPDTSMTRLKPILWTFRMLDAGMRTFKLEDLTILDRTEVIDGCECVVLTTKKTQSHSPSGAVQTLWLDRNRDFSVLRYTSQLAQTGIVTRRVDISYKQDKVVGWIPTGWSLFSATAVGRPFSTSAVTVSGMEINGVISPLEFQTDFPANTVVTVNEDQNHYAFLLRADGTRRSLGQGELAAMNKDELLRLLAEKASLGSWGALRMAFLMANAIIVVALGIYLARKRMGKSLGRI